MDQISLGRVMQQQYQEKMGLNGKRRTIAGDRRCPWPGPAVDCDFGQSMPRFRAGETQCFRAHRLDVIVGLDFWNASVALSDSDRLVFLSIWS